MGPTGPKNGVTDSQNNGITDSQNDGKTVTSDTNFSPTGANNGVTDSQNDGNTVTSDTNSSPTGPNNGVTDSQNDGNSGSVTVNLFPTGTFTVPTRQVSLFTSTQMPSVDPRITNLNGNTYSIGFSTQFPIDPSVSIALSTDATSTPCRHFEHIPGTHYNFFMCINGVESILICPFWDTQFMMCKFKFDNFPDLKNDRSLRFPL